MLSAWRILGCQVSVSTTAFSIQDRFTERLEQEKLDDEDTASVCPGRSLSRKNIDPTWSLVKDKVAIRKLLFAPF
jgi:hypothetical protein